MKTYAGFILDQSGTKKKFVNNIYIHLGKNLENLSQHFYRKFFDAQVLQVSIVQHERYKYIGATPDGFAIK